VSEELDSEGVESFSMPFGEHLEELRRRLLWCLVVAGGAFLAAWLARGQIMAVLVRPHALATAAFELDPRLKFRTYLEPVTAQLKACMVAALVLTAPFTLYQMWAFVAPGLYRRERRLMLRLMLVSLGCFAAGVCFGYFVFIPLALRFLLALSGPLTEPALMIGSYLSLLLLMTLALGVAFQTPLVMYHLVRWQVVSAESLQRHRKVAVLSAFVLGAFFTPPDPFTQLMMAVPLIMLYDLGVLAAAPSRRTLLNFARFAGTVGALLAVAAALFLLWPVGALRVTRGRALLASRPVDSGREVSLRRGQLCRLEPGAAAAIRFGKGAKAPHLLLAGEARVQLHGRGSLSLYRGRALADSSRGGTIRVRSAAARVTLRRARAELIAPEPGTLTVNVLAGEALAESQGRRLTIPAGRTATFRRAGQPLDTAPIERWWRKQVPAGPAE